MKVFTFLGLILFAASTLSAQPVRDMVDALAMVRAHEREMHPALEQVREAGLVLGMFANVQRELSNVTQPQTSFDKAISDIDEYLADVTRRGALLDRETRAMIESTRRLLDAARLGPPMTDVTQIREKIHHNTIHPLQRRAVQMTRQVEGIMCMYETLSDSLRNAEMGVIGNMERLAIDPEKP